MTADRARSLWLILGTGLLALLVAACAPAVSLPTDSASPEVVLDTYLRALVAGDCSTASKLGVGAFKDRGSGNLCGDTRVSAYGLLGDPARPSSGEQVFATTLTTTGSADGTVPAGEITWFFTLRYQPDGSWRITGGGSGP